MKIKILQFLTLIIVVIQVLKPERTFSKQRNSDLQLMERFAEKPFSSPGTWHKNEVPEITPEPVSVEYRDVYHLLYTEKGIPLLFLVASADVEKRASALFNHHLEKMGGTPVPVVSDMKELPVTCSLAIRFSQKKNSSANDGGQSYQIKPVTFHEKKLIEAVGSGVQGCMYSAATLGQLITKREGKFVLREATVKDRPAYTRRIFSCGSEVGQIQDALDWMIRYKMDCMKLGADLTPRWKINKEYEQTLDRVNEWNKKYGGVHIMLALHIYRGKQIIISNPSDREALKKIIKAGLDHGVDRVMIQADDIAPFKNGEGYILTSEEDKAQFANMAEAHCFLMQDLRAWLDKQGSKCELYYCPPFYTYEDCNLGDMGLYKDTPWEEGAFGPLKRDLQIIGENMPEDVFVIWTGPNVRTRKITDNDFRDWKANLGGRAPFLWDNTMYGHHPFTTTALFTAYENEFPDNFHKKTAGYGMYLNGDATTEVHRVAYMTANDFLWNPGVYVAERSINNAIISMYGADAVAGILGFRDAELTIRRLIGERQLKAEIDTLWSAIAKVRSTTGKNPFYYHRIYIRLKGLLNQLRCSIPTKHPKKSVREQITEQEGKRQECLKSLEHAGLNDLVEILKKEMVQSP